MLLCVCVCVVRQREREKEEMSEILRVWQSIVCISDGRIDGVQLRE